MPIEDVFSIKGRGTVGTGRIERGMVKVGDAIEIVGLKPNRPRRHWYRSVQQDARQRSGGENVGVLLRGIEKEDLERGRCCVLPRASPAHEVHR